MRVNYYMSLLILCPMLTFASTEHQKEIIHFSMPSMPENTVVNHYSNESEPLSLNKLITRTDFPTQIVRVNGNIEELHLTCAEVNKQIDTIFIHKIGPDRFIYNTYIFCGYNPKNNYAINFSINSYFDPIDDEAIDYLQAYLKEYNHRDFLGTQYRVGSARGLIAAMTINTGLKKDTRAPLTLYRQDHSSFYFNSNFDMRRELMKDIYERFYSSDPEQLLPFFDKWVFPNAGKFYHRLLVDSNYVEARPERIFLMDNEPTLFVSNLKYYFAHDCSKNPNKHCL